MGTEDEWVKLPGLFHRWEFEQVIRPATPGEPAEDWFFEEAGRDDRGATLFAVYHRPHAAEEETR